MLNTRNFLVAHFLSVVMTCALWSVTNFKSKTDLDSILLIKNMSDKMEAELSGELRILNSSKKYANVINFDKTV